MTQISCISNLKEPCQNFNCRHSMFWKELELNNKAKPEKISEEFMNCMCLLSRELTLEEIGEMWGLTRERVRQIERDAIIKILSLGLKKTSAKKKDIEKNIMDSMGINIDNKLIRSKIAILNKKKRN